MITEGNAVMQESPGTVKYCSPLPRAKTGRDLRVRELCGSPEVTCRLREIGLHEGAIIRVIASHSNIICQVCNARFAISARLAELVMVESLVG